MKYRTHSFLRASRLRNGGPFCVMFRGSFGSPSTMHGSQKSEVEDKAHLMTLLSFSDIFNFFKFHEKRKENRIQIPSIIKGGGGGEFVFFFFFGGKMKIKKKN